MDGGVEVDLLRAGLSIQLAGAALAMLDLIGIELGPSGVRLVRHLDGALRRIEGNHRSCDILLNGGYPFVGWWWVNPVLTVRRIPETSSWTAIKRVLLAFVAMAILLPGALILALFAAFSSDAAGTWFGALFVIAFALYLLTLMNVTVLIVAWVSSRLMRFLGRATANRFRQALIGLLFQPIGAAIALVATFA